MCPKELKIDKLNHKNNTFLEQFFFISVNVPLIDIIDLKNTRLSDKNGASNMPYILSKQTLRKEM